MILELERSHWPLLFSYLGGHPVKWCPVVHRSEKVGFKRLKLKMALLCITKATASKNLLVPDRVSVVAEHTSNAIEKDAYYKKVPQKTQWQ